MLIQIVKMSIQKIKAKKEDFARLHPRSRSNSAWQRSSVAEQGTHKPLVAGSNPAAATCFLNFKIIHQEGKNAISDRKSRSGKDY